MKEFQDLKDSIRTVPDYPVKGVQFRDITTLLQNRDLFKKMIDGMTKQWAETPIDAILSIESRGFIMAGALAFNLNAAFVPLRKPQKLPFHTYNVSYELEYGATDMHIHKDALNGHKNLLLIDNFNVSMILSSLYNKTLSDDGLIISPVKYASNDLFFFGLHPANKKNIKIHKKILFK